MYSMKQIYNLLAAGKKLSLKFATKHEAERFRVKMHQQKLLQERALVSLGMMEESERLMFAFTYDAETTLASLSFTQRKPRVKTFEIIEITEANEADNE